MPRDANGNYTLPSGNPVVTNTLITSTWANDTMSDLANEMQDSLSRSGKGGFTAPVGIVDKSGSVPGLNFLAEPTSGFKREGTGDVRVQVVGADNIRLLSANRATDVWNNDLTTPAWERVFTTPTANLLDANTEKTLQIKRETTPATVPGSTAAGELGANIGDDPPILYVGDGTTAKPIIPDPEQVVRFPSGTTILFEEPAAAPTGWVKKTDAAYDDVALRIVTGTPSSGGSVDFSTVFGRTATDGFILQETHIPAHNHGSAGNHNHNANKRTSSGAGFEVFTETALGNQSTFTPVGGPLQSAGDHTHSSFGGGSAHAHDIDLQVKYREAYFATKS